jgi:uncharacterized protein with HEPN domain
MRREELYLADIIEAADSIEEFLRGVERTDFVGNDLLQSAVLQKLIIIGEAAARLPKEFRNRHTDVEWSDIVSFRNIAVHAYFSVDWVMVWVTAKIEVPELSRIMENIIVQEYADFDPVDK